MQCTLSYLPGKVVPSWGRNQSNNVHNRYQNYDQYKRVLAVCSAGILRSATIASVLNREYNYNTRNCGISIEYALIPISVPLLNWADHIVFAEQQHFEHVREFFIRRETGHGPSVMTNYQILNISDDYSYNDPELIALIKERFDPSLVV